MNSVCQINSSVKPSSPRRGPGQPSKQTPERIRAVNRTIVGAALTGGEIPPDAVLGEAHGVSERTVRDIRLRTLGLNRRDIKRWQRQGAQGAEAACSTTPELVCRTPFAGLWLLVPQIIDSGLAQAGCLLRIVKKTRVQSIQVVLTVVAWSALGFRRFFHVGDFRDWADMGLALFTGALHLWSDTTLWRWMHGATPASKLAFYQATAGRAAGQPGTQGRFSLDEHVVPSFTKRKPSPLGKTRVPTRGRSYPAFRLYASFDLDLGRFVGLLVRQARESLSQVLPDLLREIRLLRRQAQIPEADRARLIFDRGGYKGSLFQELTADPQVSFIAMARATKRNVRQWDAIPESRFRSYQLDGDDNPNLKIARSITHITDCQHPLPSVVSGTTLPAPSSGGGCSSSRTNLDIGLRPSPSTRNTGSGSIMRWDLASTSTLWSDTVCPRRIKCFASPTNRDRSEGQLPQPRPLRADRPFTWWPGSSS